MNLPITRKFIIRHYQDCKKLIVFLEFESGFVRKSKDFVRILLNAAKKKRFSLSLIKKGSIEKIFPSRFFDAGFMA